MSFVENISMTFGRFVAACIFTAAVSVGGVWFVVDQNLQSVRQTIGLVNDNVKRVERNMVTAEALEVMRLEMREEFRKTQEAVKKASLQSPKSLFIVGPQDSMALGRIRNSVKNIDRHSIPHSSAEKEKKLRKLKTQLRLRLANKRAVEAAQGELRRGREGLANRSREIQAAMRNRQQSTIREKVDAVLKDQLGLSVSSTGQYGDPNTARVIVNGNVTIVTGGLRPSEQIELDHIVQAAAPQMIAVNGANGIWVVPLTSSSSLVITELFLKAFGLGMNEIGLSEKSGLSREIQTAIDSYLNTDIRERTWTRGQQFLTSLGCPLEQGSTAEGYPILKASDIRTVVAHDAVFCFPNFRR